MVKIHNVEVWGGPLFAYLFKVYISHTSMQALLGTDGVAEAFRCQTVSVSNTQHSSRTFYMTASSNEERDAWVEAVMTNIQVFSVSNLVLDYSTMFACWLPL